MGRLWLQYTASTRLEFKNNHNAKIKKAEAKKSNKKPKQTDYCFMCYIRGHRSNKCRNASGEIWNPKGERTFNKPDWWEDKIPDPATAKGKQKKKIKKTTKK